MNETYEKDDANKIHKEYKSKTWQWENEKICITESRYRINSSKMFLFNQRLPSSRYFVNSIFLSNTKSIRIWKFYLILEDLDIFRKDWDISSKPPPILYSPFYIFTELCKCLYTPGGKWVKGAALTVLIITTYLINLL